VAVAAVVVADVARSAGKRSRSSQQGRLPEGGRPFAYRSGQVTERGSLSSDDAATITGQAISVDGGITLGPRVA
jgi:hypothetical protein